MSVLDTATLLRMKAAHPALWRKLVKAARKAEGRTPITTDAGDAKRALTQLVGTSGRQRRNARKAIQRAMRAQQDTTPPTFDGTHE